MLSCNGFITMYFEQFRVKGFLELSAITVYVPLRKILNNRIS